MAKRRTKAEKENASYRWEFEAKDKSGNTGQKVLSYYSPQISLPVESIRSDLTKTLVVTILALLFQIGIALFFSRGGEF